MGVCIFLKILLNGLNFVVSSQFYVELVSFEHYTLFINSTKFFCFWFKK